VTDATRFIATENAAGAGEQKRTDHSPPSHEAAHQSPAVREYLPRLVIYTAPDWCEPCRRLDKEVDRLKSLDIDGKRSWEGLIGPGTQHAVQVIDASCDPSPEMTLAKKSRVKSWPTTIRLDATGKEEWRYTGTMTAEQLSRFQAGTEYPGRPARKVNAAVDGLHTHKCERCSFQWAHSPATITDHQAAHRCPRCNAEQYEIDHMGPEIVGAR
jgi:thiol-disulfide isomerase/thioredoxin